MSTSRYKISVSTWYSVASHPKSKPVARVKGGSNSIHWRDPKPYSVHYDIGPSHRDQASLEKALRFCQPHLAAPSTDTLHRSYLFVARKIYMHVLLQYTYLLLLHWSKREKPTRLKPAGTIPLTGAR
ncbi:hypothetical protein CDD82_681 [Ophiocordyceps australis]|uniref:Uncharacterized protein n=1 Tax=Ophiocordyceps australis TaxID=1399860 RepID=A0A2C5YFI5_9HYPO|nr:hypothetical protein CDD82_681 [Ophiocordyceps australis]